MGEVLVPDGAVAIRLGSRRGVLAWTLVDEADAERVLAHRWCASVTGYAVSRIGERVVKLHRFLLDPPPGRVIDHLNTMKLDNRRVNLRIVGQRENLQNRGAWGASRYNGVSRSGARWRAAIQGQDGRRRWLGTFASEEEAARAYDAAALQLFARPKLNFPDDHPAGAAANGAPADAPAADAADAPVA